jgi:hypothetical protein
LEKALSSEVTLVPTVKSCEDRGLVWGPEYYEKVPSDSLVLAALNPIKGWRQDEDCTALRNFLVEVDTGTLQSQLDYVKAIKMPYSAIVFSGNKSMHFLISLDQDLPNETIYRLFSEWILAIATMADQQTKNPSRSIRIPGGMRKEGRQRLVDFKGAVKLTDLVDWLKLHPGAKPQPPEKRQVRKDHHFNSIKPWAIELLQNGLDASRGRNNQWYAIAYEFALSGYSEDDTIEILGNYFTPERGFKEREWLTTIKSAYKHAYED